jgi:hypothetical protein
VWEGQSAALPSAFTVRSMPVDVSLLFDEMLTVRIVAVAGADQNIAGNSIGVDFSTLTIETAGGPTTVVPLPAAAPLLAGGLAALGFAAARRRRV